MMIEVVYVAALAGRRMFLRFADGVEGEVDVERVVRFDGVFERLRDDAEFLKAELDPDWGTVRWPGDIDIAPEALYAAIRPALTPG